MKNGIVLCIQARMGSSRFPGKMLAPFGGLPLFAWVALRVLRCQRVPHWFLATSSKPSDDPLAELARTLGVDVYRGDEADVLSRFGAVIRMTACAHIVRVCGDNPLIAPEEVERAIAFHLESGADYTFNHIPERGNRYPDGLGAEVFCRQLLLHAQAGSRDAMEREHINKWVRNRPDAYKWGIVLAPDTIAAPDVRLDVDTPADLDYLRRVLAAGALSLSSTGTDIVAAARAVGPHPQRTAG